MSNKEILDKAMQKAIDGGWNSYGVTYSEIENILDEYGQDITQSIIFDHDFAKALWGEKKIIHEEIVERGVRRTYYSKEKDWKEHLQLMVISDDPIKYLGDNI